MAGHHSCINHLTGPDRLLRGVGLLCVHDGGGLLCVCVCVSVRLWQHRSCPCFGCESRAAPRALSAQGLGPLCVYMYVCSTALLGLCGCGVV